MPSGMTVANMRLATTESWKDKQSGEQQERTEWHRVALFGRLAEIAGEYLKKGSQVYVEGSLRTRKWQDKDGQDRYSTEIRGDVMQMLGPRAGSGEPREPMGQRSESKAAEPKEAAKKPAGKFDDMEDDIPF